jgi:hypothetical protein
MPVNIIFHIMEQNPVNDKRGFTTGDRICGRTADLTALESKHPVTPFLENLLRIPDYPGSGPGLGGVGKNSRLDWRSGPLGPAAVSGTRRDGWPECSPIVWNTTELHSRFGGCILVRLGKEVSLEIY